MEYLLKNCKVDDTNLGKHILHFKNSVSEQQAVWKMKDISLNRTRPSIQSVLRSRNSSQCSIDSEISSGQKIDNMENVSFEAFCNSVRFPNCMSHLLRIRCYLLASQSHNIQFTLHTHKLVCREIADIINQNPILSPDTQSLMMGIETLTLNMAPFQELRNFRSNCFNSYSGSHISSLTMTDIFKLYISAYQKPSIWKQLWKNIHPLMSTQISKDVESFVKNNQFAEESFIQILKTSTPFIR